MNYWVSLDDRGFRSGRVMIWCSDEPPTNAVGKNDPEGGYIWLLWNTPFRCRPKHDFERIVGVDAPSSASPISIEISDEMLEQIDEAWRAG